MPKQPTPPIAQYVVVVTHKKSHKSQTLKVAASQITVYLTAKAFGVKQTKPIKLTAQDLEITLERGARKRVEAAQVDLHNDALKTKKTKAISYGYAIETSYTVELTTEQCTALLEHKITTAYEEAVKHKALLDQQLEAVQKRLERFTKYKNNWKHNKPLVKFVGLPKQEQTKRKL